jgi:plastocyanin
MPFALLQLLSVASAQISSIQSASPTVQSLLSAIPSSTAAATPTPSTEPTVHLVKVGAGGFKFEPASLEGVLVGDVVTFEFYPPDHSVARADFNSPCMPYEYSGRNRTGFFSDVQWVKTVNDVSICFIAR